jgi:hypothetical protein
MGAMGAMGTMGTMGAMGAIVSPARAPLAASDT